MLTTSPSSPASPSLQPQVTVENEIIAYHLACWESRHGPARTLELGHPRRTPWGGNVILNKFEANGLSVDVLNFQPTTKFDVVLAPSTLAWIGEAPDFINPDRWLQAWCHLWALAGGMLIASFPVGYRSEIDAFLKAMIHTPDPILGYPEMFAFELVGKDPVQWNPVTLDDSIFPCEPVKDSYFLVFCISRKENN